jgi:hypothetical protein
MSLSFQQIILTAYRANFILGQFTLADYNDGNGIVISNWNVPNVTQPNHDAVMALDTPTLEALFNFYAFVDAGTPLLAAYVDSVARQQQYNDAVSCASYVNSSNATWKAQAETFIAWRDSVYAYVIAQEALMQNGARTIPTFAEFQTELPVIVWTN